MSKPVAIFGAGVSAQSARRLAQAQGLETVLFDEGGEGDRSNFDSADLQQFDSFVFSPGFAAEHPWRVLAEKSGLPCLSEIAFAARYWKGRIIGITGTNGKSTLTALIEKTLILAERVGVAAGNIGYPFSDAVLSDANERGAFAVLEISSFQAELADGLRLDALLWTNFAEDHLDRYGSMKSYFKAKARLFDCLKSGSLSVVGPEVEHWMTSLRIEFDACTVARADADMVSELAPDSVFSRFPYSENYALAYELCWLLGESPQPLIEAANTFSLAPHRLDVVAERGDVRFWNDSKATNFHATLAALQSVGRPTVWIGGGRVKGGDVEAFASEVAPQVDAAVLYGEVSEQLAAALEDSLETIQVCPRFEDAVIAAAHLAEGIPHANVLLSPGFASFDQFESYNERGKSFNSTVLSLKDARKPS